MPKKKGQKSFDMSFEDNDLSPTSSPLAKKSCQANEPSVSNADILCAVNVFNDRFTSMEQQISQNSITVANLSKTVDFVGEELKSLSTTVKTSDNKVSQIEQVIRVVQGKVDQAEIYSRRWNLRLINLKEAEGGNIRNRVLEILKILTLDEADDIHFYVDTLHRTGRLGAGNNRSRPVIIQFELRDYREKIWKAAQDHPVLKERCVRLTEDLTFAKRQ